jgi:glycosyltransferase involved in cell wall biosynthesis
MPAISVIVPTRLRHQLLHRALHSLLVQTFSDFEILLVDDNPPHRRLAQDATLGDLLREPRVRLFENRQPRNAAAARNIALREARGEWITYLDDDDAYRPAKLEEQLRYARATGISVGTCGFTIHLGVRKRTVLSSKRFFEGAELLFELRALVSLFHPNPRTVFFDERLDAGEDAVFFHHLTHSLRCRRIFNVPSALIDVHLQPSGRVNTNAEAIWSASQIILRDYAPTYGARACDIFARRARLAYLKSQRGHWKEMFNISCALFRLQGAKAWRVVGNAWGLRIPGLRSRLIR